MSKLREAAQKALGLMYGAKLCKLNSMSSRSEQQSLMAAAIDALRAALAEPEQITAPPLRKPLDKSEVVKLSYRIDEDRPVTLVEIDYIVREVERLHGIKGEQE